MKYRVIELREGIDKFIDFDRKISWDFVSEDAKTSLSFEEYAYRHRRLIEEIFRSNIENKIFLVIDERESVVGAVWVGIKIDSVDYVPLCYIYDLEVAEGARGRGVGSSLLNAVESFCRERGVSRIALMTPIENTDSVAWYLKRGFRVKRLYFEKKLKE